MTADSRKGLSGPRLVLILLFILAVVGLFRLKLDVEVLHLLPGNNQVSQGLLSYQKHFLNSGELIITLESEDAEKTAQAVTAVVAQLRPATNLVKNVFWQAPWNESIQAPAQFLSYLWLNAPAEKVVDLARNLDPTNLPSLLAAAQDRMATSLNPMDLMLLPRDPYGLSSIATTENQTFQTPDRFFGSATGQFRMIYTYAAVSLENYDACHRWVAQIRGQLKEALQREGLGNAVRVQLTGRPVFVDEIASGMKSDMSTNAPGTLFMIGLLFYLVHREVRALLLLLLTLLIVMVWTALAGAAFLGELNVISIGFASILLGLAEDFAIVLHQEAKSHPGMSLAEVRRLAGPGIFWSAVTTAAAFALLNLSSLPGLRQLGTLVALGILLGAWAMTYLFLPWLFHFRKNVPALADQSKSAHGPTIITSRPDRPAFIARAVTALILLFCLGILWFKRPVLNSSPDVLRPRASEASRTLAVVQKNMGVAQEPYWLLIHGDSVAEVRKVLDALQPALDRDITDGQISSYNLPRELWPDPALQTINAPVLRHIAAEKAQLMDLALTNGFTTNGLELTSVVLDQWNSLGTASNLLAKQRDEIRWPQGRIAEWLLPRFASVGGTNIMALGLIYPTEAFDPDKIVPKELAPFILVSGWRLLGKQISTAVEREVPLISLAVFFIVLIALALTFRNARDVILSFAVLAFSAVVLLAVMAWMRWDWNLINLTSWPLLLGMGIDYSIHIQLTLKRLHNNRAATFQSVGRALLLAGSTSIIGFGLLGTSSNLGMASLGEVCALGLTIVLLTSVFLLPAWNQEARMQKPSH